ncbi:hypothetical protein [Streptomyces beihaiensis]|uniref:Uncharacterized protein n=1 Tax=Streptomyces beihaiensis TaxID=2984495 RepID=A0ABT3TSX3_9ACTN|nr:hypothetical protein [Streptomyces beihaiensis]MCX3059611.1 hypothetical protein [Streptomyces beihaiensis]
MPTSIAHTSPAALRPTFVPPLDVARSTARQVLDEANALDMDTANSFAVAREFGGVCEVLRQVFAALDAEEARRA